MYLFGCGSQPACFSTFIECASDEAGPEFVERVGDSYWSVGGKVSFFYFSLVYQDCAACFPVHRGETRCPHYDEELVYSFLDLWREHP